MLYVLLHSFLQDKSIRFILQLRETIVVLKRAIEWNMKKNQNREN